MKLYELTTGWSRLRDLLSEMTDTDEIESFTAALSNLESEINDKAENIAVLIKECEAESTALREEAKSLMSRRNTADKKVDSLKKYLLEQLTTAGITRVDGTRAQVRIQENPGRVVVHNLKALKDNDLVWQKPNWTEDELDKTRLKMMIERELLLPEVASIERSTSLRIK